MKSLLTVFLLLTTLSATVFAQDNAIDKYFSQYVSDARFSVVYISPQMFSMIGDFNMGDIEVGNDQEAAVIKDISKGIKSLRILSTDKTPDKFYQEFKSKINTAEYEVLMTVKDKDGGNVEFLAKGAKDNTVDELLLLSHDDEFVMISFIGKIDLSKVSKLKRDGDKGKDE